MSFFLCRHKAMIQIICLLTMGLVLIKFYDSYIPHKKQLARSTNISLNRIFNWDDLDLSQTKKAMCGQQKCFFLDKLDPNIGYLIKTVNKNFGNKNFNTTVSLTQEHEAFDQAQRLKVEYNIRHFLDGPPFIDKVPTSKIGDRMNSMINIVNDFEAKARNQHRYFENTNVIVQRNRMGPIPHALIGCLNEKKENSIQSIENLINNSIKPNDRMRFYEHFHDELSSTAKLLQKEPLLVFDFQVMIDTNGRVYHLDFERMYDRVGAGPNSALRDGCQDHLKKLSEYIMRKKYILRL